MNKVCTTPAAPATDSPAADAGPTPARHLLNLMMDALSVPSPAGDAVSESAYLLLLARRSALVLAACRTALSSTTERGLWLASERLYSAVSDTPATYDTSRDVMMPPGEAPGLTWGHVIDIVSIFDRAGYRAADDLHTGRAIGYLRDIARIYAGEQDRIESGPGVAMPGGAWISGASLSPGEQVR